MDIQVRLSRDVAPLLRDQLVSNLEAEGLAVKVLEREGGATPSRTADPATLIALATLSLTALQTLLLCLQHLQAQQDRQSQLHQREARCEVKVRRGKQTWAIRDLRREELPAVAAQLAQGDPDAEIEVTVR